jgi:hypothetical protein
MKNIIFIFFLYNLPALGQISFNRTYDAGVDGAFNVVELDDGYMSALFSGFPIYPTQLYLVKTDFNGDTLWTKQYGNPDEYVINYSLIRLSDFSLIAGCYGNNFVLNQSYIYLFKLKYDGDTIWTKKILAPAGFDYYGQYIRLTSDKKLLITGEIADNPVTDGDAFILMADTNGNYEWHQTYGGANYDALYSSVDLPDKGFLSLGWTRSFGFGNNSNRDFYLVKTDSLGTFQWNKTYGDTSFETGVGITPTMDGNYLLAGYKEISSVGHAWIIKIDSGGTVIWNHTYNFGMLTDLWWSRELSNKDIISAGACRNAANQKDEGLIFCTDEHGYMKWYRTFPMNNNHACFRDVQPTSDGGFICAGFCFVGASGNQDAWLVKLDSLGCDSAGCANYYTGIDESQTVKDENISIYPNPASEAIFIRLLNQKTADTFDVSLFNSQGAEVLRKKFLNSGNAQPVDVRTLVKGLYLIKVKAGDDVYVEKVIVN